MRLTPALFAIPLVLAGCATTKVALFDGETSCGPSHDQQCPTGSVEVLDENGADVAAIDKAYTRGRATYRKASVRDVPSGKLTGRYGALLDTLPKPPKLFVLNFAFGSDDIGPEGNSLIAEMLQEIRNRPGADVVIVGHTDRVGEGKLNDDLSIKRAQAVLSQLIGKGLDAKISDATGRGERDPIERPDEDNIPSEINRRVEIYVK